MSTLLNTVSTATAPVAVPASTPDARPTAPGRQVAFSLLADADPGTLPRILELVAKRGHVPLSLRSDCTGDSLAIEMKVGDLPQAETDHICRCLSQIPMVARVTVTEVTADSAALLAAAE